MKTNTITTSPVRIRDARELLSTLPYVLGYRPAKCVLVVCVRRTGELGLVVRIGNADAAVAAERARAAQLVAKRAAADGAAYAFLVAYCPTDIDAAARLMERAFATALATYSVPTESWLVTERTYRNLGCTDPTCCGEHPVAELEATVPGAELVLAGVAPAASREARYAISPASPAARSTARSAARRWQLSAEDPKWRADSLESWRAAIRLVEFEAPVGAALLGRLATALADPAIRDAVIAECLAPGDCGSLAEEILEAAVAGELTPPVVGGAVAETVLEAVVAHATRAGSVAPLAMLALLAWWRGDGGCANFRIEAAMQAAPDYRLAHLLAAVLDAGIPPGWIGAQADSDR